MAALTALTLAAWCGSATADPLLDQKKAQYAQVRAEVRRLDAHAEKLTEQYDHAVWRLQVLRGQIRDANRRLKAAQAELLRQQALLGQLLVASYKGGDGRTLEILFGATSLAQVTDGLDVQQRLDTAVTQAVDAIHRARDEIIAQRAILITARQAAERQRKLIAARRKAIRHQLALRSELMRQLGTQVRIGEAANSIGQTKVALEAAAWIRADQVAHASDPGAVLRDQIALDGLAQIGVPYRWGGASPENGFDCSGLVMWLWAQHGYSLPHFAAAQYHLGPLVTDGDLRIGDLVFFHDLGHVGIYIGHGYVLHAPHTGVTVQIESFSIPWFQATYVGATRPGPA